MAISPRRFAKEYRLRRKVGRPAGQDFLREPPSYAASDATTCHRHFSPLSQINPYFRKKKVSEKATPRSAEDALADLQSRARYVFDVDTFAALTGRLDNAHGIRISLKRLAERGLVTTIHKRPMVYVIVPPEYRAYGAQRLPAQTVRPTHPRKPGDVYEGTCASIDLVRSAPSAEKRPCN